MKRLGAMLLAAFALATTHVHAEDATFKPFVLASSGPGTLDVRTEETVDALEAAGFRLVGRHSPVPDSHVLVVTSDALLQAAAASDRGGYAAGQRVSVSQVDDGVEVAFVNPVYLQYAYRMETDLGPVRNDLVDALGYVRDCGGGDKKMTAERLGKYRYMMGMQQFDDPSELGSFASHEAAVAAVLDGLAKPGDGLDLVYRIDVPGSSQTVIGIGMSSSGEDRRIDEAEQLAVVDFEGCRKRAYFPYEVLVNGNDVEALHMRFRMAVHFPNLSMMGSHGFTKLMPFPGDIESALEALVASP
ncbi:MAG: hypothetical protein V2I57_13545 [Xanthomonadales bacterium]|jgi:hypothetical protein|nr:hypothetical protein [Xanthomonadales bacterium]